MRGGMAWLNVIPELLQYQVSSELFRIRLNTATLVPVGGGMKVTKCVCGYCTASQLNTGFALVQQLLGYNPVDDDAQQGDRVLAVHASGGTGGCQ